jgi:hypothetical protein
MPQKPRPYRVPVKLDRQEHQALAARAVALSTTRSAVVRDALRAAADDTAPTTGELTRVEALQLLAEQAKGGSAVAAAALARELRIEPVAAEAVKTAGPVSLDEVSLDELQAGELRVVR